jgi:hypothetical protein
MGVKEEGRGPLWTRSVFESGVSGSLLPHSVGNMH